MIAFKYYFKEISFMNFYAVLRAHCVEENCDFTLFNLKN